jgi:hypothetical protein
MGEIIERLLKENPEKRLEYIAISELENPDEIKRFYNEYKIWIRNFLKEEFEKGRSLEDVVSTNLGYVIGYLSDPKLRTIWYDTIGNLHPAFGRC